MNLFHLLCLTLAALLSESRCPDLWPPVNGVLKCQQWPTEPLIRCSATCYQGYVFHTNQHVVTRTCSADAWLQEPAVLPACIPMCDRALLAGSNKQLTASSSTTDLSNALFSHEGAWQPSHDDIMQYIQVDLGSLHRVAGWSLRGDGQGSYVQLFRLLFSEDGRTWIPYSDTEKFFTGNFDSVTEVTELLSTAQISRYVLLNPLSWHNHIALKWDLVGCPLHDSISEPTPGTGARSCKMPAPPVGGALNCESNGTNVVCTAYCQGGLVFENFGPAVDLSCDPQVGLFSHTPLPDCIERNMSNSPYINISGPCLQEEHDCFHISNGNYQYCGDCHYFSTCSEGYFFVRPCPAHLHYDSRLALCNYDSTTCRSKTNITHTHP